MSNIPHTAMVLAAGIGSRMRPLTEDTAKPLIPVNGKALLDRMVDPLVAVGVQRIVLAAAACLLSDLSDLSRVVRH